MPIPGDDNPDVLALLRLYTTAARRLTVLIRRALAEDTRAARRIQLVLCRQIVTELRRRTAGLSGQAMRSVLAAAVSDVDRILRSSGAVSGIQAAAARIGAENLTRTLDTATVRVGRRVEDVFRPNGLIHATAQALAEKPTAVAARRLREELERQGLEAFVDRAGRRWNLDVYSRMVIRTTTSELQQRAVADRMREHGFDLVEIPKHEHARDECSPYEGRVWSLTGAAEGYPVLPQLPPYHANCLVPDTEVLGDAKAVLRRHYEGEIVVVHTADGRRLACTPNHPVLTLRGWVAAGRLTDRDHLAGCGDPKRVLAAVNPDHDWQPAFIGEKAEALPVVLPGVPVAAEDFHGDGRGSDVYEVFADRDLSPRVGAHVGQPTDEREFGVADVVCGAAVGLRAGAELGLGALAAADGGMGGLYASSAVTSRDAFVAQSAVDRPWGAVERRSDVYGGLTVEESADDLVLRYAHTSSWGSADRLASRPDGHAELYENVTDQGCAAAVRARERLHAVTRHVAADKVVRVNRARYSGQVLDLSTSVGWYVAAGLIVHNCEHFIAPASIAPAERERRLGLVPAAV